MIEQIIWYILYAFLFIGITGMVVCGSVWMIKQFYLSIKAIWESE